ncbi:MAG: hypothetical protein L0214_08090, partial [candidate division NC10 bacterium]|nr:hypothetical protein [candidate division NC10 bacterium]
MSTAAHSPYTYISLGAGVQSTALLILSALGLRGCPRAEVAIFADTQDEPAWVYRFLERLEPWAAARGIPVLRVTAGRLSDQVLRQDPGARWSSIPAWTPSEIHGVSPLHRQCTAEYKIRPIQRKLRELLGVRPRQRVRREVLALLGISVEEAHRMRPSRTPLIRNAYPLVDARMGRGDCVDLIRAQDLPVPKKSACVFCPYHAGTYWLELRDHYPEDWAQAVRMDNAIRNVTAKGVERPVFLHRSLRPLQVLELRPPEEDPQLSLEGFGNEC